MSSRGSISSLPNIICSRDVQSQLGENRKTRILSHVANGALGKHRDSGFVIHWWSKQNSDLAKYDPLNAIALVDLLVVQEFEQIHDAMDMDLDGRTNS
jgi:hypothetical protein